MATVKALWEVAQDNQLYAAGPHGRQMVEQVLPVGVAMAGDKPQIVINEKSAHGRRRALRDRGAAHWRACFK